MIKLREAMSSPFRGRSEFNGDLFLQQAQQLQQLSGKPWPLFTEFNAPAEQGSQAKDNIWQDKPIFNQHRQRFEAAVNELEIAANSRDPEQIRPKLAALEESCKACHQRFRVE